MNSLTRARISLTANGGPQAADNVLFGLGRKPYLVTADESERA
jgi:hypothetical protein